MVRVFRVSYKFTFSNQVQTSFVVLDHFELPEKVREAGERGTEAGDSDVWLSIYVMQQITDLKPKFF